MGLRAGIQLLHRTNDRHYAHVFAGPDRRVLSRWSNTGTVGGSRRRCDLGERIGHFLQTLPRKRPQFQWDRDEPL
jgi:hypothetical protein